MSAAVILDRLTRVKQTGSGRWIACCPAHEDRSPSLSIRELPDGRILLHDFGGCATGEVLATLGLSMRDLFSDALGDFRSSAARVPARDVLEALDHEITVASLILADVLEHHAITEPQWTRLAQAAALVGKARDHGRA